MALAPVPDPLLGPLLPSVRRRRRLQAAQRRRILRNRLRNLLLGLNTSGDRLRPDTLFSGGGMRDHATIHRGKMTSYILLQHCQPYPVRRERASLKGLMSPSPDGPVNECCMSSMAGEASTLQALSLDRRASLLTEKSE